MVRSDYPYEVPVWNLSPIMFQTGSFVFARRACPHSPVWPLKSRPGHVAVPEAVVTGG